VPLPLSRTRLICWLDIDQIPPCACKGDVVSNRALRPPILTETGFSGFVPAHPAALHRAGPRPLFSLHQSPVQRDSRALSGMVSIMPPNHRLSMIYRYPLSAFNGKPSFLSVAKVLQVRDTVHDRLLDFRPMLTPSRHLVATWTG
jgi:hypothetical protein